MYTGIVVVIIIMMIVIIVMIIVVIIIVVVKNSLEHYERYLTDAWEPYNIDIIILIV